MALEQRRAQSPDFRSSVHTRGPLERFVTLHAPIASNIWVVKTSGKLCDTPEKVAALAAEVKSLTDRGLKVILVHGGGPQIDSKLSEAGISTVKDAHGVRITPVEAMPMISGVIRAMNVQLSYAIASLGVSVASSKDGDLGLINGTALMQRTGTVTGLETAKLRSILGRNDAVVLSCLGKDQFGDLNINADSIARAVAQSLGANLLLLSDVSGVKAANGSLIRTMDESTANRLQNDGTISNGMVVKVEECIAAVKNGVPQVVLADGSASFSLGAILSGKADCTRFVG